MTYKISNINLTCFHAGADTFSDDDTYAIVHDKRAFVYNSSKGGIAEDFPMGTGNIGYVLDSSVGTFKENDLPTSLAGFTDTFSNSVVIKLMDSDLFDPDDSLGSAIYVSTGNEAPNVTNHLFANLFGSGSSYQVTFDITRLGPVLKPRGKVASEEGGVLNGKNTDGTLVGRSGKDIINANGGDDIVVGGGNDDVLNGGTGDDLIFGGKGNDILSGGAGSDIFVMARGFGVDTIKDFNFRSNGDLIGLGKGLTFEDLSFKKIGNSTQISVGNDPLALLQGVKPGQLTAANFTQFDLGSLNTRVKSDMAALGVA